MKNEIRKQWSAPKIVSTLQIKNTHGVDGTSGNDGFDGTTHYTS